MKIVLKCFIVLIIFFTNLNVTAAESSTWYTRNGDKVILHVKLFLSSTCSHCQKAEAFFKDLETKVPWIKVSTNFVDKDKNALILFNELLNEQHLQDFAVPSLFFCNSRWVGFASAETTGDNLLHALNYCKQQILKQNKISIVTTSVLSHWANANMFDANMIENPAPLKYMLWIGSTDAISPCSLFCLIAFLTLLFVQNRSKDRLIKGLIFILILGLVHVFQQTEAELFYTLLFWLRIPALIAGFFVIYVGTLLYKRKSIQFLGYLVAFILGLLILAYQQTCMMNWSYVFQQWLTNQSLSTSIRIWYQFIYQCIYLFPLILGLIVYVLLMRWNKLAQLQQRLNDLGCLYLMLLGLVLIINPWILASGVWSLVIIFVGGILGFGLKKYYNGK